MFRTKTLCSEPGSEGKKFNQRKLTANTVDEKDPANELMLVVYLPLFTVFFYIYILSFRGGGVHLYRTTSLYSLGLGCRYFRQSIFQPYSFRDGIGKLSLKYGGNL